MLRYVLGTDICSYVMKRSNDQLLKRLQKVPVRDICVSVITKPDLLYGVEMSPRQRQDEAALSAFVEYVEVLEVPDKASQYYAQIRSHMKKLGIMIGGNDLFIAAYARSLGLTLVSHNTREFGCVPRLIVEDWTKAFLTKRVSSVQVANCVLNSGKPETELCIQEPAIQQSLGDGRSAIFASIAR